MPEASNRHLVTYQLRSFFARNPTKAFSVPELKRKFGESVQHPLLSLCHEGYLNVVLRYGMPYHELGKH